VAETVAESPKTFYGVEGSHSIVRNPSRRTAGTLADGRRSADHSADQKVGCPGSVAIVQ
jgi:hypothetical protein